MQREEEALKLPRGFSPSLLEVWGFSLWFLLSRPENSKTEEKFWGRNSFYLGFGQGPRLNTVSRGLAGQGECCERLRHETCMVALRDMRTLVHCNGYEATLAVWLPLEIPLITPPTGGGLQGQWGARWGL